MDILAIDQSIGQIKNVDLLVDQEEKTEDHQSQRD